MADWQTMDTAPKDRMINLFCPGVSSPSKGVLQGQWSERLSNWVLNPYGTTQPITLFPNRWVEIDSPPEGTT